MKRKILAFMVSMVLVIGAAIPAFAVGKDASVVFSDVAKGGWYYTAVQHVFDNGLFEGKTATTFAPYEGMTRGMFVTVLGRAAGVKVSDYAGTTFLDVPTHQYYAPYVKWAVANGITDGTGYNKFSPNAKIKREEMVVFFARYAQNVLKQDVSASASLSGFSDSAKTASWAVPSMQWAVGCGIIAGDKGMLTPRATANRGQCAQILYNAKELLAGKTWFDAAYNIVEHPAETEKVWVIDKAGYTYPVGLESLNNATVKWYNEDGSEYGVITSGNANETLTQRVAAHLQRFAEDGRKGYYQVYESYMREICNDCGADISDNLDHIFDEAENGGKGSYRTESRLFSVEPEKVTVSAQGHYETKVIKEAWTEKVLVREAGWY